MSTLSYLDYCQSSEVINVENFRNDLHLSIILIENQILIIDCSIYSVHTRFRSKLSSQFVILILFLLRKICLDQASYGCFFLQHSINFFQRKPCFRTCSFSQCFHPETETFPTSRKLEKFHLRRNANSTSQKKNWVKGFFSFLAQVLDKT